MFLSLRRSCVVVLVSLPVLMSGCAGGGGGSTSTNSSTTPTTPAVATPTISGFSPASVAAGTGSFVLTVNGTNFTSGSTVYWNGSARATTYVSATQVTAAITAADVTATGTANVAVVNGSSISQTSSYSVTAPPAPTATSLSPSTIMGGSPGFTLTVNGSAFDSSAKVYFGNSPRATTFVSSTQLQAAILGGDIVSAGSVNVTVQDAGTTTAALPFTITAPPLAINSITPNAVTQGALQFSLQVSGTAFVQGSTVQFGATPLVTNYQSSTSLTAVVPASLLLSVSSVPVTVLAPGSGSAGTQTSNAASFSINPLPAGQFIADVIANDIAGDPTRNVIYASVPSAASSNGNSVVTIDATSGKIVKVTAVGSEPNRMAISDDGKYLYVALDGSSSVKRLILPDMTEDFTVSLGADQFFGANVALDLAVSHVDSNVWASTSGNLGVSPAAQKGVVIYDGKVARPNGAGRSSNPGCSCDLLLGAITFGADSNTLIGANNESTGFDLYVLTLDANGVKSIKDYGGAFSSFTNSRIHYDSGTGYVYADAGTVANPLTGAAVGRYNYSGSVVTDSKLNTTFFAPVNSNGSTVIVASFDQAKFTPLNTISIANVLGSPSHLVRWGVNGIAFNSLSTNYSGSTYVKTGRIYIYSGNFVKQ